MDSHYTYAAILAGSLSIPLVASFLKPLMFSKNWRAFGASTLLVGAFFIAWDIMFTQWGVWGFNEAKHLSVKLMGLPIEEILFFFVVPFCCPSRSFRYSTRYAVIHLFFVLVNTILR